MQQQRPVLGLKVDQEFADMLDRVLALTAFFQFPAANDMPGMDGDMQHYSTRSDFLREAVKIHLRKTMRELAKVPYLKPLVEQELEVNADWEKWME